MLKKLLATALALFTAAAFAATDVNKATQAEIESVKGIGPAISTRILDERKKREFKDWPDLVARVKGIGGASAAKFSQAGMTVNGAAFAAAPGAASASGVSAKAPPPKAATATPTPTPASAAVSKSAPASAPTAKALPGTAK